MLFAGSKSSGIGIKIWTKEVVTSQKLSSSLGEAKNYRYQRYFVPYKICFISFHRKTTMFYGPHRKPLKRAF
jgi:hypothetical protein